MAREGRGILGRAARCISSARRAQEQGKEAMSHSVIATTAVACDPATAFEAFTTEVDAWWKQGPKYRPSVQGAGVLRFEPRAGGRFLETYRDGSEFVFGRIQV